MSFNFGLKFGEFSLRRNAQDTKASLILIAEPVQVVFKQVSFLPQIIISCSLSVVCTATSTHAGHLHEQLYCYHIMHVATVL